MRKTCIKSYLLSGTLCFLFQFLTFNSRSTTYYVNDASTIGDIYCSALGNNLNNGLSPATPKASLTNLLTSYTGILTSGDIIQVDAGSYSDANVIINNSGISIIGAGPAKTIFDNAGASADANRLFTLTANNIVIQGIYVRGYNRGTGGASAIQISGVTGILLNNVLTDENRPGGGAATIVIDGGSTVTFNGGGSNCNSTASVAGGGVNVEGNGNNVTFNDYSFSNNSKSYQGGSGLYIVGNNTTNVTVNNSIFSENRNTSSQGGGGIFISGANLNLNGSCFSGNSSFQAGGPNYGGAISVGRGASVTINNCSFTNNSVSNSGNGGAISMNTGFAGSGSTSTVNLTSCTFTGNTASSSGYHLYARVGSGNPATMNINECTFSSSTESIRNNNTASINLQNSGTPSFSGTVNIINNTAPVTSASTNCPVLQGSCYGIVLPVELISFRTECREGNTEIHWSTASEHNNDYFILEHATEDALFKTIGIINGQQNSTTQTDYTFTHHSTQSTVNYYRISQTDLDGKTKVLNTQSHLNDCSNNQELFLITFNNNDNSLEILSDHEIRKIEELMIFNTMGQLIFKTNDLPDFTKKKFTIRLNEKITSGVYIVQMKIGFETVSAKIILNR